MDDFYKHFVSGQQARCLPHPKRKRCRECRLSLAEVMTLLIAFQLSPYRTFKDFYIHCVCICWRDEFPDLLSYTRFVELIPHSFIDPSLPAQKTGRYYIDSTKLAVCRNLRIFRHKVFKGLAKRGKTSMGWFFGFKLHLVLNDQGELVSFALTLSLLLMSS